MSRQKTLIEVPVENPPLVIPKAAQEGVSLLEHILLGWAIWVRGRLVFVVGVRQNLILIDVTVLQT